MSERERRPPERVKDAGERGTRTVVVRTGGLVEERDLCCFLFINFFN
jgi:hypothetical protein